MEIDGIGTVHASQRTSICQLRDERVWARRGGHCSNPRARIDGKEIHHLARQRVAIGIVIFFRQPIDDFIYRTRAVAQPHDRSAGFIESQRGFREQQHFLLRDSNRTSAARARPAAAAMHHRHSSEFSRIVP